MNTTASYTDNSTTSSITEYNYFDYAMYTEDLEGPCMYERPGAYFLPVLYSIFFILGLLGNTLVLWVILCGVQLRSMTDVCLLNLAFADLLLVCSLPFVAHQAWHQWVFGDAMCKVVLGAYYVGFYSGIFFITLMSIDRYLAIVHAVYALRKRTRSAGVIAASLTWLSGFLASFPDAAFLQQQMSGDSDSWFCAPFYNGTAEDTTDNQHFWNIFALFKINVLGLLIPTVIMGFCYAKIIWRLQYGQSSKRLAIRLVLIVIAVFVCCWVPYNVASFFKALELMGIYTECNSSKAIRLALLATESIAYSHSCINPILYVFVGEKFRRHLLKLMSRAPCHLCRVMRTIIPMDRTTGSTYSQTTSLDERSTAM